MSQLGQGQFRINSDYLILLLEFGSELGFRHSDLLASSGLTLDVLMRPGVLIGHESFLQVVENFQKMDGDLRRAVEYGKRMSLSKHGALGVAARHSRTTDEAATRVTAFMETRAEIFDIRRERSEQQRTLYVSAVAGPKAAAEFMALAYLTSIDQILRQMLGSKDQAIESFIDFPGACHWAGENHTSGRQGLDDELPGAEIVFAQPVMRLVWPSRYLNDLLPLFDQDLVSMADQACAGELESIRKPQTTKDLVEQTLKQGANTIANIESVASVLNMSSATLKRKLKAENTSFREVRDQHLYQKARLALAAGNDAIELIADQLGYSDASNFAKAFKSWSGMTPREYRQQANGLAE